MEKILTQSDIAINKKDSLLYGVAEETIAAKSVKTTTRLQKFMAFCEQQQENRLAWTAFTIAAQACLVVTMTLLSVYCNGNPFVLWIPVILSSFVIEVSNLMALPTKITIPIFCLSVLLNVGVIIASFMP